MVGILVNAAVESSVNWPDAFVLSILFVCLTTVAIVFLRSPK